MLSLVLRLGVPEPLLGLSLASASVIFAFTIVFYCFSFRFSSASDVEIGVILFKSDAKLLIVCVHSKLFSLFFTIPCIILTLVNGRLDFEYFSMVTSFF